MWELDNKAEHWRTDAFELWCWRRLLRVPWTARRSNQSILKEIKPEYSLEGLTLKLKLQYLGYLMWTASSLEKTLILGKIEGRRRRGWQDEMVGWHHQFSGHGFDQTPGDGERQGDLSCCSSWVWKASDTPELLNHNILPITHTNIFIWSSSAESLSRVWLFATPWTAAHQASLSITNS